MKLTPAPTLLLISALTLLGCRLLNDPVPVTIALPEATQSGANTMGCLADGSPFNVEGRRLVVGSPTQWEPNRPNTTYLFNSDQQWYFSLWGELRYTDVYRSVRIAVSSSAPLRPGTYAVDTISRGTPNVFGLTYADHLKQPYVLAQVDRQRVLPTVTFTRVDTVARILSGAFQGDVRDTQSGRLVSISEGRFDVRY